MGPGYRRRVAFFFFPRALLPPLRAVRFAAERLVDRFAAARLVDDRLAEDADFRPPLLEPADFFALPRPLVFFAPRAAVRRVAARRGAGVAAGSAAAALPAPAAEPADPVIP